MELVSFGFTLFKLFYEIFYLILFPDIIPLISGDEFSDMNIYALILNDFSESTRSNNSLSISSVKIRYFIGAFMKYKGCGGSVNIFIGPVSKHLE